MNLKVHEDHKVINTKNFKPIPAEIEKIGKSVLDAAFRIHSSLGPGLLESVYESCLVHELSKSGIVCQRQVGLPVVYDDLKFEEGFRIDVLVENKIVLELKSAEALLPVHQAQMLTYLRLFGCRLGYLINFKTVSLKSGIKRFIL